MDEQGIAVDVRQYRRRDRRAADGEIEKDDVEQRQDGFEDSDFVTEYLSADLGVGFEEGGEFTLEIEDTLQPLRGDAIDELVHMETAVIVEVVPAGADCGGQAAAGAGLGEADVQLSAGTELRSHADHRVFVFEIDAVGEGAAADAPGVDTDDQVGEELEITEDVHEQRDYREEWSEVL